MKILPSDLPPQEALFFQVAWNPGKGLDPWGIRALLERVQVTREQLAMEAGVRPHYVDHVITRNRRSSMVEGLISGHLAPLGLSAEHIWGPTPPPRSPTPTALPEGLESLRRFSGRFLPSQHGIGLVVDCETTGFDPKQHALVELGLIAFVFSRNGPGSPKILGVLDAYTGLQDPGTAAIHPMAMKVNKLQLKDLRRRRLDQQRIHGVISRAELVIAHNAGFDRPFVTRVVPSLAALPWLCSLRQIPWKELGHSSTSLGKLCAASGIEAPNHRALSDCRALLQLLSVEVRLSPREEAFSRLLQSLPGYSQYERTV
jgi:DNA polymerase-3 subunit epsilon